MSPGRYTELFFLDEATALAAGHRPCGECQRGRLAEFRAAWQLARVEDGLDSEPNLAALDRRLHQERSGSRADDPGRRLEPGALADGMFVSLPGEPAVARLCWQGALWRWVPAGYRDPRSAEVRAECTLLTPASTARAIAAGFRPGVHPSTAVAPRTIDA
jgi:hypothetical protein